MAAKIQIEVGADVRQAVTGLKQLEQQSNKSFSSVSREANNMAKTAAIAGGSISKTATNFTGLSRIIQDLPFGFLGIANNIQQVVPAAGALGLGISAITSALLFAQVGFGAWTKGLDGLLKGDKLNAFSIIKDTVKEAAKSVGESVVQLEVFRSKLTNLNIPASERVRILKEYNDVAEKTNQIDASQINNLELINQKINAQNALILKRALSTAAMGTISEAANKLIENEVKLQEQLSKRGFKDLDAYDKKQKEVADNRLNLFKNNPNAFAQQKNLDGVKQSLDGIVNPALKAADAFNKDEVGLTSLVEAVKNGRGELQKLIANLSGLITIEGLTTPDTGDKNEKSKFEFLFNFLPFDPNGKLKPEQRAQLLDTIGKFQKEFIGILDGVRELSLGTEGEQIKRAIEFDVALKAGNVKIDVKSFRDAIDKKFKPEELVPFTSIDEIDKTIVDKFIRGLQNESDRIKAANINLLPGFDLSTDLSSQIDLFKTRIKQLGARIPKEIEGTDIFGNPITLKLEDLFDTTKISNEDAINALRKALQGVLTEATNFQSQLTQLLQSVATNSFVAFGEAIGNAVTGGGIGNAFQSLFSLIGAAMADLGKQMIALSPIIAGLKAAIKTLNPALMLPAGIALVAIGSALRNLKPKGFAEGGLVFGPTFGLIGEGVGTTRNNPEVVAPLDKLQRMLGGTAAQNIRVTVDGGWRGNEFVLGLARVLQSQGRNFGRSSF